jgi:hypothetical protein
VLRAAIPEEFSTAVPMETPLSRNITLPVGGPPVVAETIAVNVTDCPPLDVLAEEVSAVVVERLMVWESALDVLAGKVASPE